MIFRAVMPPEFRDIVEKGRIVGMGNVAFSHIDKRSNLVFFGLSIYEVQDHADDALRYIYNVPSLTDVVKQYRAADMAESAARRAVVSGDYASESAYEKASLAFEAARKAFHAKADKVWTKARAEWRSEGATSYVLEAIQLNGAVWFGPGNGSHATRANDATYYEVGYERDPGFPFCAVTKIHRLIDGKVVSTELNPAFSWDCVNEWLAR